MATKRQKLLGSATPPEKTVKEEKEMKVPVSLINSDDQSHSEFKVVVEFHFI